MGFFDNFYKKKPENNKRKKFNFNEEIENRRKAAETGMSIQNGILKRVYPKAVVDGTFIVPKEATSIGLYAFSRLDDLQTVVLHEDIKQIAQGAFQDCKNLVEVKGLENANSLNSISGFAGCVSLRQINLPQSIENIGFEAFLDCENLSQINIPSSCWSISKKAFAGCEKLQIIKIPAAAEVIEEEAFAGCKNATIVFLEDDKKLMADIINEQKAINTELYGEDYEEKNDGDGFDNLEEDEPRPTLEERIQMYEDFNIRYRIIDISGQKFFWQSGPLVVKSNAFASVKELVSISNSKLETAVQSGYKGKITLAYIDNNATISLNFKDIEKMEQIKKAQARAMYYSQFLIPSGGTTNWLLNCEKNNYHNNGYAGKLIWSQQIANDAMISVVDFTQPKSELYKYTQEEDEFYTSVTFVKKELNEDKRKELHENDKAYNIYYPFGARFDTDILTQIGLSLNILIDTARELADNDKNKPQLELIAQKQKQIIELFFNGTNNKDAVTSIMDDGNLQLLPSDGKVKLAKHNKDWLPYFTNSIFSDFEEVQEYRKNSSEKNHGSEFEKE